MNVIINVDKGWAERKNKIWGYFAFFVFHHYFIIQTFSFV